VARQPCDYVGTPLMQRAPLTQHADGLAVRRRCVLLANALSIHCDIERVLSNAMTRGGTLTVDASSTKPFELQNVYRMKWGGRRVRKAASRAQATGPANAPGSRKKWKSLGSLCSEERIFLALVCQRRIEGCWESVRCSRSHRDATPDAAAVRATARLFENFSAWCGPSSASHLCSGQMARMASDCCDRWYVAQYSI